MWQTLGRLVLLCGLFYFSQIAISKENNPTLQSVADLTAELTAQAAAEQRVLSLEEVLFAIGKKYPALRQNYILMHDSQSRQHANFEFPRVITHTVDGRFAMAFSGDPDAEGYDELEMYEFSADGQQQESFKFRRIIFQTSSPIIKPINEPLCQGCHGQEIRPNWEAYNIWEGAYPKDDIERFGGRYIFGYKTPQDEGFHLFYTRQSDKGRYRFLERLKEQFTASSTYPRHRVAPSQFTQVAGYLNYRRIAHLIRKSPDYHQFKWAVLAGLYNCANFEKTLPLDFVPAQPLSWYRQDTAQLYHADANRFLLQHEDAKWANLRFLFEGRGISMHKWSMSFRRAPYTFVTPGGSSEGFVADTLMEYDPSLEPFRVYKLTYGTDYFVTTDFVKPWNGDRREHFYQACEGLAQAQASSLQ